MQQIGVLLVLFYLRIVSTEIWYSFPNTSSSPSSSTFFGTGNMSDSVNCLFAPNSKEIYIGGSFSSIVGTQLKSVGKFYVQNNSFDTLDGGLVFGNGIARVNSMVNAFGKMYFCGLFDSSATTNVSMNNIGSFEASWQSVTSGLNGECLALAYSEQFSLIFVGGSFSNAGGIAAKNLASFNSWGWIVAPVWSIVPFNSVFSLFVSSSSLFVGGNISTSTSYGLYCFNLTSGNWSSASIQDSIYSIGFVNDQSILVGGSQKLYGLNLKSVSPQFTSNTAAVRVILNDSNPTFSGILAGDQMSVAPDTNSTVFPTTLLIRNDMLGMYFPLIAPTGRINAMAKLNDSLFVVGGSFETLPFGICSRGLGFIDLSKQSIPPPASNVIGVLNGPVYTSWLDKNNTVFIGGAFTVVGGLSGAFVASWSGSWKSYPMHSNVLGIAESANFVYTLDSNKIMRINGTGAVVYATIRGASNLAISGNLVIVSGTSRINHLGGVGSYLWFYSNGFWNSFTSDLNGPVYSMVTNKISGDIWIGGSFTAMGNVGTNGLIRYSSGSGTFFPVTSNGIALTEIRTLLVNYSSGDLIVAGNFSVKGGSFNIAGYNSVRGFYSFGYNDSDCVRSLVLSPNNRFLFATSSMYLRVFDSQTGIWKIITFFNQLPNTLVVDPNSYSLFVGGSFSMVNDTCAPYLWSFPICSLQAEGSPCGLQWNSICHNSYCIPVGPTPQPTPSPTPQSPTPGPLIRHTLPLAAIESSTATAITATVLGLFFLVFVTVAVLGIGFITIMRKRRERKEKIRAEPSWDIDMKYRRITPKSTSEEIVFPMAKQHHYNEFYQNTSTQNKSNENNDLNINWKKTHQHSDGKSDSSVSRTTTYEVLTANGSYDMMVEKDSFQISYDFCPSHSNRNTFEILSAINTSEIPTPSRTNTAELVLPSLSSNPSKEEFVCVLGLNENQQTQQTQTQQTQQVQQSQTNSNSVSRTPTSVYAVSRTPTSVFAVSRTPTTNIYSVSRTQTVESMNVNFGNENASDLLSIASTFTVPISAIQIGERIGKGSFGDVRIAKLNDSNIVCKLLKETKTLESVSVCEAVKTHSTSIKQYFADLKTLSALSPSPHVAKFIGISLQPFCILTEFVEGICLADFLRKPMEISCDRSLLIMKEVAVGLNHLHENKIIHKDLATRNVMLRKIGDEEFQCVLTDMCLSPLFDREGQFQRSRIAPVQLRSCAPEVLREQKWSEKSDIWSYGMLSIEVFSRETPCHELSPFEFATSLVLNSFTPTAAPLTPNDFRSIVNKCFSSKPSKRPTSKKIVNWFDPKNEIQQTVDEE